jgi:RNA polymerase sigma factor (sigma-70 family)
MAKINFSNIETIYSKYIDKLYSYALHLGFDESTAMDAIHDVFYKLCINHSSLNKISNLKFYLFKALRNRLVDLHRTNREYLGLSSMLEKNSEEFSFHLNVSIEDELIEKEDWEEICKKVENVLNRLTDRQREIIYLRYIQEQSYEEISEIMHITVESSRNLISKSLSIIKGSSLSYVLLLLTI